MSSSTYLSSEDAALVVGALETLSDEKTKELVFHLGVPTYMLQNIGSRYSVESQRIHSIQTWLDKDTEASWEKIVRGLIGIKMNVLAKQVATQHCPQFLEAASALIKLATVHTTQLIPTPAQEAHATPSPAATPSATDSEQSLKPATSDDTQTQLAVAIRITSEADVKATIMRLEKKFVGLVSSTRAAMCDKERHNHAFLDEFRDHLFNLPVSKKAAHIKFFRESEDDILEAKNVRKIFVILSRYWSYNNHEILLEVTVWFCDESLQASMQEYCKMLEGFEKATTVDIYVSAIPLNEKQKELKEAFSKIVVQMDKPSSECTLYDIRVLNEAIVLESYLKSHSVYISSVTSKCVVVEFTFPTSAVGWVLAAMTPTFMTTHLLTEVTVDGECLTIMTEHMNVLVRVI